MDVPFEFECEGCGVKVKTTLRTIAKGKPVKCRNGHSTVFEGKGLAKAQKELDDLEKQIKGLGGTFNLEL